MTTKLTQEQFIKRATEIHGNVYDYSRAVYKGNGEKLSILCKRHGEFCPTADKHLNQKTGCPKCANEHRRRKGTMSVEELKTDLLNIHNEQYEYLNLNMYENLKSQLHIKCRKCGTTFFMVAQRHKTRKCGCRKCAKVVFKNTYVKTLEQLKEDIFKTHQDDYEYLNLDEPKTINNTLNIQCKKCHHKFKQTVRNHVQIPSSSNPSIFISFTTHSNPRRIRHKWLKNYIIRHRNSISHFRIF